MARKAFAATRGTDLGEGQFSVSAGANTPISASFTAIEALQAAVDDAQAAAEANATIAGDGTALGLVQDIGTAFAAYVAAVTAGTSAAAAKNVVVDYDDSVITTRNALRRCLDAVMRQAEGHGLA